MPTERTWYAATIFAYNPFMDQASTMQLHLAMLPRTFHFVCGLLCTVVPLTSAFAQPDFRIVAEREAAFNRYMEQLELGNLDQALSALRHASATCRDTNGFAMQMADLYRMKGDTALMVTHLREAIKGGRTLEDLDAPDSPFRPAIAQLACTTQLDLYHTQQATPHASTVVQEELELLGEMDQWVREHNRATIPLYDSLNYARLVQLTRPMGRFIPSRGSLLVLVHVLDNAEKLAYWEPLLDRALIDGDIDSGSYATILDRAYVLSGRPQRYGTDKIYDPKGGSPPLSRFNVARATIGLAPLP